MIGRAARNIDGQVVMYADRVTDSMRKAISETNRRRKLQLEYNFQHGIDPQTIRKKVTDILDMIRARGDDGSSSSSSRGRGRRGGGTSRTQGSAVFDLTGVAPDDLGRKIQSLEEEMREAAKDLRFEEAARLRELVLWASGAEAYWVLCPRARNHQERRRCPQSAPGRARPLRDRARGLGVDRRARQRDGMMAYTTLTGIWHQVPDMGSIWHAACGWKHPQVMVVMIVLPLSAFSGGRLTRHEAMRVGAERRGIPPFWPQSRRVVRFWDCDPL
jgi:hypothetical protein